jgi:hypothetical protein
VSAQDARVLGDDLGAIRAVLAQRGLEALLGGRELGQRLGGAALAGEGAAEGEPRAAMVRWCA